VNPSISTGKIMGMVSDAIVGVASREIERRVGIPGIGGMVVEGIGAVRGDGSRRSDSDLSRQAQKRIVVEEEPLEHSKKPVLRQRLEDDDEYQEERTRPKKSRTLKQVKQKFIEEEGDDDEQEVYSSKNTKIRYEAQGRPKMYKDEEDIEEEEIVEDSLKHSPQSNISVQKSDKVSQVPASIKSKMVVQSEIIQDPDNDNRKGSDVRRVSISKFKNPSRGSQSSQAREMLNIRNDKPHEQVFKSSPTNDAIDQDPQSAPPEQKLSSRKSQPPVNLKQPVQEPQEEEHYEEMLSPEELERIEIEKHKKFMMHRQYYIVQPNHPGICFLHLFFKVSGVFSYVFLGFILRSTLLNFLMVFCSIVLDFWISKNISGRYLVGLRWWSTHNDETGEEEWDFESYDFDLNFSQIDTTVFWWGICAHTIFWAIMFAIKVLGLNFLWGLLTFIGILLNGTNVWAFYKCSQHHKEKMMNLLRIISQRSPDAE